MSSAAFTEFEELEEICIKAQTIMQDGNIDTWSYIWGSDNFTVKKMLTRL
jgi:hypothetical protein